MVVAYQIFKAGQLVVSVPCGALAEETARAKAIDDAKRLFPGVTMVGARVDMVTGKQTAGFIVGPVHSAFLGG